MLSTLLVLVLVLACPIGMWLMMRGGHGHGGHGDGMHGGAATIDELRRQRAELDRRISEQEGR